MVWQASSLSKFRVNIPLSHFLQGENKSQPFSVPLSIVAAHFLCLSDIFQGLQQTRLEVEANVVVADTILIAS